VHTEARCSIDTSSIGTWTLPIGTFDRRNNRLRILAKVRLAIGMMDVHSEVKAAICAVCGLLALSLFGGDPAAAQWTGRADIAGRWVLHMPSRAYCVMGFSGDPDGARGTIAANGFCPRLFLARPRWRRDGDQVVISNRRGEVLADLAVVGRGYLRVQIATGEDVSLTR
jgi:hypothetical protein